MCLKQSHLELLDLHFAAIIDDGDVLHERPGSRVCRERSLVAPGLANEKNAGTRRGSENVVCDASVLLNRSGSQFLGGGESIVETAFLGVEEAVESKHGLSPFDFMFNT